MFHYCLHVFRPRHPLARLLYGVIGVAVALALIAIGTFAIAALAVGGLVFWLISALRTTGHPPATSPANTPSGAIEGEFTIVRANADTHTTSGSGRHLS
jgi:hypothetical protein